MNEEEVWLPVVGWEGVASVSSLGSVKSDPRLLSDGRKWTGKILNRTIGRSTYLEVSLPSTPHSKRLQVHRVVCMAFHGPPTLEKPMALHRNGDKFDNRSDNLYWGDYDDNMRDRVNHGRHFNTKTHCKFGHELTAENTYTPPSNPNSRYCRACRKRRHDKWYDGVKGARNV